jgi:hypothetical protein
MNSSPAFQQALRNQSRPQVHEFIASAEWQNAAAEIGRQCLKEVQGATSDVTRMLRKDAPRQPNTRLSNESRRSFMIGFTADCLAPLKGESTARHYKDSSLSEICSCAGEKLTDRLTNADVQKMLDKTSPAAIRFQKNAEKHLATCKTKVLSQ